MVKYLNDTRHNKPELALTDSKSSPMTLITDNPLDDFSHSDTRDNQINKPTGMTLPPFFYTKRPIILNKMARLKLFPNESNLYIAKQFTELFQNFIQHQYKTPLHLIFQISVQPQMTILLRTLLAIMTMTVVSKFIPKQIIIFRSHHFNLKSFCFQLSYRTFGYQLIKYNHIATQK